MSRTDTAGLFCSGGCTGRARAVLTSRPRSPSRPSLSQSPGCGRLRRRLRDAGSAARRQCRPCGRWSPRRRPPNRTCDFHRIRLSMSTSSGCPLAQLALEVKYPLPVSGNGAPVFTGDLLPSSRAACSLDPFALWTAFPPSLVARDCHDYYGSSATPRRQQRTMRLPRAKLGGHRRDASHVHSYTGWQGRRPAVPRGHRRALPQHGTRPRPPER
jgi:hypothetical protein